MIGLVNGTWPPLTTWLTFHRQAVVPIHTIPRRPLCLAAPGDISTESEPVMITDLSHCTPRCALATTPELDRWRVIEYQADGISGKMIEAQGLMEPPDVTLPMQVQGWHKIHIGYWSTMLKGEKPQRRS